MSAAKWLNNNCRYALRSPIAIRKANDVKNDYAKANVDYEESGDWFETVFEVVPLAKINMQPVWNKSRFEDNFNKIQETGQMPPVILSFDDREGVFIISDGIHRTNAAKALNYDAVPAIVSYRRTEAPPKDKKTEIYRSQQIGFFLGQAIRRDLAGKIDSIDVKNPVPGSFTLELFYSGEDQDYSFAVQVQHNKGKLQGVISGFGIEFNGTIQEVAKNIAEKIKPFVN